MNRRELIHNEIQDLVGKFCYYDRKEDESLPLNSIEDALAAHEVTEEEIVAWFREEMHRRLND